MKALIIYDSRYGNTEKIAQAIQQGMGGAPIPLVPAQEANADHLRGVDLLVVGSPTHGGRASKITQEMFQRIGADAFRGIPAAAFDTGLPVETQKGFLKFLIRLIGYAARHIAKLLARKGAKVLGKETFFVLGKEGPLKDGELARAQGWGRQVAALATRR